MRKSPRDIKAIIDRTDPDKSTSLYSSSRVYQMFQLATDTLLLSDTRQSIVSKDRNRNCNDPRSLDCILHHPIVDVIVHIIEEIIDNGITACRRP